jgi:hypothetical protein
MSGVAGSRSAQLKVVPAGPPPEVPMSGHSALIRDRIVVRREEAAEHSPEGVELAAIGLAAMHDAAYRNIAAIRCDRPARYRVMQFQGEKGLPFEDLALMVAEGGVGAEVVLAGLRVLARRAGFVLTPAENALRPNLHETTAELIERTSPVAAGLARALADDVLEPHEVAALEPQVQRLKETVSAIEMSLQRAGQDR